MTLNPPIIALDLYAGTGWGVAAQRLGIHEIGVENMREAMDTRMANGMSYGFWNVLDGLDGNTTYPIPDYDMLIASPPCQEYSMAGGGEGRARMDETIQLLRSREDLDTDLITVPMAYILRDMPTYVVLEQVPPVLPIWEEYAHILRQLGYSVWVGILNAGDYGVPQSRRRAILIARRDGVEAEAPAPTGYKAIQDVLPYRTGQTLTSRVLSKKATVRQSWEQAPTITSKAYMMEWSDGTKMSIQEAAMLQSYPEDFEWVGGRQTTYLQIGNAVPPAFAEAILGSIRVPND